MKLNDKLAALFAFAVAVPTVLGHGLREAKVGCDGPVVLDAKSNVWLNYTLHPNNIYRPQAQAAIERINDTEIKAKATKIPDQGTFVWIESRKDMAKINQVLTDVPCNHILGLVIAGLPYKECLVNATPPSVDPWDYEKEFIDPIVDIIRANSHTAFSLIIEPNAMASFVTNPNNASCSHVQRSYRQNVPLALKKLDLPNVVTYLDAAHGGIFGWRYWGIDYPNSASDEMLRTWTAAGTLTQFRGLAVNVGSYNAWDLSPGETFDGENPTCPDDNKARSEILYLQILRRTLQSALKRANSTSAMPFHAIMDTSRSGVQGIRSHWTDWCNVKEASFGIYPVAFGKDNLDAFVWATMPGFSDGASEVGSIGYTPDCALVDSFKPMPARGMWSQEYFESLFRWFRERRPPMMAVRGVERVLRRCEDGRQRVGLRKNDSIKIRGPSEVPTEYG